MKATVIVDNTPACGLKGEWGLCIHVEHEGRSILLDFGKSGLFAANMRRLGIPAAGVDAAALSHAHYDHANGMELFLALNSRAKVFLRKGARENCWKFIPHAEVRRGAIPLEYIGIPRKALARMKGRITYAEGLHQIFEDVWLMPHSRPAAPEIGRSGRLYVRNGGRLAPDTFIHEQSLVVATEEGIAVFNSCCHAGADAVLADAEAFFPGRPVTALAGGFHLYNRTPGEVRLLAARLRDAGAPRLYTGHCTGQRALGILAEELGSDKVTAMHTGLVIEG